MADTGWKLGTASASAGSDREWTSLGNVLLNDGNDTTANAISKTDYTDYLVVTDFEFGLGANDTIDGIEIRISRKSGTQSYLEDSEVYLVSSTTPTLEGSNQSTSATWRTYDFTEEFGSSDALLGWTDIDASDVNSDNFGVAFRAYNSDPENTVYAYVDYIEMKIHYTVGTSSTSMLSLGAF